MALDLTSHATPLPVQAGREGALGAALAALGSAALDQHGVPVCRGMAIAAEGTPLLTAGRHKADPGALSEIADPVLPALGLRLFEVEADGFEPDAVALAVLMLRVGLLGRILDRAHAHLKGRVSMGKKTLSHQLVKVGFADAYATMRLQSELVRVRQATGDLADLGEDHARLTASTLEAEKLMGGHGYLLDGTHPIGYLSMLLHAIYGPR